MERGREREGRRGGRGKEEEEEEEGGWEEWGVEKEREGGREGCALRRKPCQRALLGIFLHFRKSKVTMQTGQIRMKFCLCLKKINRKSISIVNSDIKLALFVPPLPPLCSLASRRVQRHRVLPRRSLVPDVSLALKRKITALWWSSKDKILKR